MLVGYNIAEIQDVFCIYVDEKIRISGIICIK